MLSQNKLNKTQDFFFAPGSHRVSKQNGAVEIEDVAGRGPQHSFMRYDNFSGDEFCPPKSSVIEESRASLNESDTVNKRRKSESLLDARGRDNENN